MRKTVSITTMTHPHFSEISTLVTKQWFVQSISFTRSLHTVVVLGCSGRCRLSVWYSCNAQGPGKRDNLLQSIYAIHNNSETGNKCFKWSSYNVPCQVWIQYEHNRTLCHRSGSVQSNLLWRMGHFKISKHCAGRK